MPADCTKNPYNVSGWFPDSIRFRFACSKQDLKEYTTTDDGTLGVTGQTIAIPQLKSFEKISNRTEGKKIVMSGTCGDEVKIGKDRYSRSYKFDFVRIPTNPIEGGYLIAGDCWWFEWLDCKEHNSSNPIRIGEYFFGQVVFEDNKTVETGATDEVREILTIDVTGSIIPFYTSGTNVIEGFARSPAITGACLPTLPTCSPTATGPCMPFACDCAGVAFPGPDDEAAVPSSSSA